MRTFTLLTLFVLIALAIPAAAQVTSTPEITAAELRHHLTYIASDELEGRKAGSKGADLAADYIQRQFKAYGLAPAGLDGSYLQTFEIVTGIEPGQTNRFSASIGGKAVDLAMDRDVRPLGFSSSGTFSGPIVFAGYGISAADHAYNDYAGIDVKDALVVMLRYHPEGAGEESEFQRYSALRYKAAKAKESTRKKAAKPTLTKSHRGHLWKQSGFAGRGRRTAHDARTSRLRSESGGKGLACPCATSAPSQLFLLEQRHRRDLDHPRGDDHPGGRQRGDRAVHRRGRRPLHRRAHGDRLLAGAAPRDAQSPAPDP